MLTTGDVSEVGMTLM